MNPLSRFLLKYIIKFGKIEFLKTFKSELIGFTISIVFFRSLNKSFILESAKDHVIASKYPFEASDLCKKWNNLWDFVNVGLIRFFSGLLVLILSYPYTLTNSSTISIDCIISGLQEGTVRFKLFLLDLISNPKFFNIVIISLDDILNPEIFSNKLISNWIFVFLKFPIVWISILLISPPQISLISSTALLIPCSIEKGSIPLSNLNLASVSIFNNFDVFLIDLGLK